MPALTIKNIPYDLYQDIKHSAERHHRSINSEVIVCLKRSLLNVRSDPEVRLKDIRLLRSRIRSDAVVAQDINRAIDEGRP